jgi:methionyl aminopeptidase
MIPIKRGQAIESMRQACRIAANVLDELSTHIECGVNTYDLDQMGKCLIAKYGATSACYDYKIGSKRFPAHTCLSVNEEVVHGIGSLKRTLRNGDLITLDICVLYEGWIGDNARTFAVGEISSESKRLLAVSEQAMMLGIAQAKPGNRVGDISNAIQVCLDSNGFGIVKDFVGHGVGRSMHEEPQIPNFGRKGKGPRLTPGMTLAIEPMVTIGKPATRVLEDGWTAVTVDGSVSAHFEHTVLIVEDGNEILTQPNWRK